ncbi:MAG: ABC transporter permease subunit [Candidatus Omnitrophica bacterium]|jgi:ABC-type transport system involved in multi-copper enzyme maturation permease subunit|nr:ABC transporter permease subunit [Candidatus Omnitrophota bacterium]
MIVVFEIAKLVIKEILRKKDFYVAFILTGVVVVYAAQLRFYDMSNAHRYLLDIGLGLSFFFAVILTVALAARQFAGEVQAKTCHVLWAKPVSRWQFVFGKFLGSFLSGAACFALFYAALLLVALTKTSAISLVTAGETFFLFSLCLMMLTALAGMLSYFVSTPIAVSVTLFLYCVISVYGFYAREAARHLQGPVRWAVDAAYMVAPHFEFFDLRQRFIHSAEPVGALLVLFLTAYAVVYTGLFLWIGWLRLRERPVA